jgi:hypothetical protein
MGHLVPYLAQGLGQYLGQVFFTLSMGNQRFPSRHSSPHCSQQVGHTARPVLRQIGIFDVSQDRGRCATRKPHRQDPDPMST